MDNNEWLKNLKVGDKVFVVKSYFASISRWVAQVERITKTGQIVIGNWRFKNGRVPSSDKWHTTSIYLEEATDEKITAWKQRVYSDKVLKYLKELEKLDYETATKISEIFGWKIEI